MSSSQFNNKLLNNKIIVSNTPAKTGRIVNGKEEYVKKISRQLGDNTMVSVSTDLAGVTITKIEGFQTNGSEYHPLPFSDPTDDFIYTTLMWAPNIGQINFKTYGNRTLFTAYVEIYFIYN